MSTGLYHGVQLLPDEDLERIQKVTDALDLHRDWVVIPIDRLPEGRVLQQPDGKLILHAPIRERFDAWLGGLQTELLSLNLGAIPRRSVDDPKLTLTGPYEIQAKGTRNYLGPLGVLH